MEIIQGYLSACMSVCDEIVAIMDEFDRQKAAGDIDTPGGLEHMGDVWSLLRKWSNKIKEAKRL